MWTSFRSEAQQEQGLFGRGTWIRECPSAEDLSIFLTQLCEKICGFLIVIWIL